LLYPSDELLMSIVSPTLEGFRAAFRRPSFTLAEIMWRWTVGATAAALIVFGLFVYLDTLPVTNGELLFLRTRHPYLVGEAIAHILRGSLNRAVMAGLLAALLLAVLWMIAASVGRIATVRAVLDYFRRDVASGDGKGDFASNVYADGVRSNIALTALVRLNFLRVVVAVAAIFGFMGAVILAGHASPEADPRPGLAFLLFVPLAGLTCWVWWALNWFLSLAGMFAVRDSEDAVGAIVAAVNFCRERTGAVFAVSTWTGLAHLVAFVGATTVASLPLGLAGFAPWRLVVAALLLVTAAYFAFADWLYMARLAGYVCIAETPLALLAPLPSIPPTTPSRVAPIQTTIDRDEPILSDVPQPGLMQRCEG
jgi:hypothetical protein